MSFESTEDLLVGGERDKDLPEELMEEVEPLHLSEVREDGGVDDDHFQRAFRACSASVWISSRISGPFKGIPRSLRSSFSSMALRVREEKNPRSRPRREEDASSTWLYPLPGFPYPCAPCSVPGERVAAYQAAASRQT